MSEEKAGEIAFVEASEWERDYFSERLTDHQLVFFDQRLNDVPPTDMSGVHTLSVFVHSRVAKQELERFPDLKFIATRSTGFDQIDVAECGAREIKVANVPYYGENTVAEHTFGLILALSRHIHQAWQKTAQGDFSLEGLQGFDLKGKTIAVVGAGSIGLHVIRIAKGFGMNVLAFDARQDHLMSEVLGFTYATFDEILATADIISLHVPGTGATRHLINRESIRKMKPGMIVINTSRGTVIDTEALLWGLDEGIVRGAGLDVVEGEELVSEEHALLADPGAAAEKLQTLLRNHALLRRDNVLVTPHSAFYSTEALHRIADTTAENIEAFLSGTPQNIVGG